MILNTISKKKNTFLILLVCLRKRWMNEAKQELGVVDWQNGIHNHEEWNSGVWAAAKTLEELWCQRRRRRNVPFMASTI